MFGSGWRYPATSARRLKALLAVVVGGMCVVACGTLTTRPAAPQVLTVSRTTAGRALPNGFLGLSFEFRGLEEYVGSDPSALDPAFLQLIRNLAPDQSPVVRIGGDSTDWTWVSVPHLNKPGGIHYSLDAGWMQVARTLARSLNARLILGINFEADSRKIAAQAADTMTREIGSRSIAALELGNEPELYGSFSWYRTPAGEHVDGRPRSYDFQDYLRDYSRIASALPRVPLAGPSSGSSAYLAGLGDYLEHEPRVRLVTVHAYPLKHCAPSQIPTISELLAPSTSQTLASRVGSWAAVAHRHGAALRVDEINSVSCGGYRNVTESFAAALWALDELFELDRAGVDGVNFHTIPNTTQHLIVASHVNGRWSATVQPEYYGLLAFAQATPAGSRLLKISGPAGVGLDAWATRAPNGQTHVVLINKGTDSKTVRLRIAPNSGPATLVRLRAPSLQATSGVTLGGQTFGSQTSTGLLTGRSNATTVALVGGSYLVRVPAASAALLTPSASNTAVPSPASGGSHGS